MLGIENQHSHAYSARPLLFLHGIAFAVSFLALANPLARLPNPFADPALLDLETAHDTGTKQHLHHAWQQPGANFSSRAVTVGGEPSTRLHDSVSSVYPTVNDTSAQQLDHYILALYWPPTVLTAGAQRRAQHLISIHRVVFDFWTHGLWPADASGALISACSDAPFDVKFLGPFQRTLEYYQMPFDASADISISAAFLEHEWLKHGTCTPYDVLRYFMTVYEASTNVQLREELSDRFVRSNWRWRFSFDNLTATINAAYPGALVSNEGVVCAPGSKPDTFKLQEVRLCVDKDSLQPMACPGSTGQYTSSTCGSDTTAFAIQYLPYARLGALKLNWVPFFSLLGCVVATLGIMWGAYELIRRSEGIPPLFLAKKPIVVHYDVVARPLKVLCEPLDMGWMWKTGPSFAECVEDLPVGMGIKGGIARKVVKLKYGTPEPAGDYDIDCVVFVDVYLPEIRRACRDVVTGMKVGSLVLEPQDVEVLTKEWIPDYFMTRDITQNEVLIIRVNENQALLFYTEDCLADIQANLIRPSCHSLKSEFAVCWSVEDNGRPYMGEQQVVRCIVRYLKGHGTDYAFDRNTWEHYRAVKLTKTMLFKILKPFHKDDAKMQAAIDHLIEIGFLSAYEVRKAGGVNQLWGLLLQELNSTVSRFGSRLTLGDMSIEDVERWVDSKKAMVGAKLFMLQMKARRTGYIPSDETVQSLGLLIFPPELMNFINSGVVFNYEAHLQRSAATALNTLMTAPSGGRDGQLLLNEPTISKLIDRQDGVASASAAELEAAKSRWKAAQKMAVETNKALLQRVVGRLDDSAALDGRTFDGSRTGSVSKPHKGAAGRQVSKTGSQSAQQGTAMDAQFRDVVPQEVKEDIAKLRMLLGVDEAKQLHAAKEAAAKRSNKLAKARTVSAKAGKFAGMLITAEEGVADRPLDSHHSGTSVQEAMASSPCVSFSSSGSDDVWLRYTAVGMAAARANELHGSFYQAALGSSLSWDDEGVVPLVEDVDRPTKQRPPLSRLLRFLLGVLDIGKVNLMIAYAFLLIGLILKLYIPRVEGALFDAFSQIDDLVFKQGIVLAAMLIISSASMNFVGRIALEVFTRSTMRTVFARFYRHLIFQELSFFARLNLGELMARTSGDSLTLRSLVSNTLYQFLEGLVLMVGSLMFILIAVGGFLVSVPITLPAIIFILCLDFVEMMLFGHIVRRLNLATRQALGRMFGFTLDSFSRITTVSALNMEQKLVNDYSLFASDYFVATFWMNVTIASHGTFSYLMGSLLRYAVLWYGGKALFGDFVTIGTLYSVLRYVTWLQNGIKQASDAYVRLMAGAGSLERIVELHDRGTFGNHDDGKVFDVNALDTSISVPADQMSTAAKADMAKGSNGDQQLQQPLLDNAAGQGEIAVTVTPEPLQPPRPDWSTMVGGVWLDNVFMSYRTKTDRSVLTDCNLKVPPGQIALVVGEPGSGKSTLLATMMLYTTPYKGAVRFGVTTPSSGVQRADGLHDGQTDGTQTDGQMDGGTWHWEAYSMVEDTVRVIREQISICSISTAGVFHATLEDNVAIATVKPPSLRDVHDACKLVGLDALAAEYPDGYRTLIGEGSGRPLTQAQALRISFARALLRQPKVLLMDEGDSYAEALGDGFLQATLRHIASRGTSIVVTAYSVMHFAWVTEVYQIKHGRPWLMESPQGP